MVKERPILFTGEMVRAVLDERKTQTRRTPGLDAVNAEPDAWRLVGHGALLGRYSATFERIGTAERITAFCPYGQAGDQLWVRETWARHFGPLLYRADFGPGSYEYGAKGWTPSIHMPRAVSRIILDVVGVRIERAQSISEADAWAEGVKPDVSVIIPHNAARKTFARLWDAINGKRGMGWAKNPWVWAVEFKIDGRARRAGRAGASGAAQARG